MKFLGSREARIAFLVLAAVASAIPAVAQTDFYTLPGCRVYDSRGGDGLRSNATIYTVPVVEPLVDCEVPADAYAVAVNVTVIGANGDGTLALFPADTTPPFVDMLAFRNGRTQAVFQMVGLGTGGQLSFQANFTPPLPPSPHYHIVLDVIGYYLTIPPSAVDDSYAAQKDTTLNVNAATGVTSNDTLRGGSILSYGASTGSEQTTIGATTPTSAGGSIALNADGSFTYNPPAGAVGIDDTFKYILENPGGTSTATVTIGVGKASQTITFTSAAPVDAKVGGPTYEVTATATSGLTVTFAIDASASSVCTIAGSTVSFIGAGTCVINADQAGDVNYNPAPQVQQSFAVGKGDQTITFTSVAPADAKVGGPTYNVTATASSTLPVAFAIDPSAASVCTIAGSTVSFIGVGTCTINANQAGDANWNPAPQVQQSFAVGKGSQTITFTSPAPADATVNGPTYNVTATASSGLPVTFTIDASATSVCSIAGSTVSFTAAGTCVINANQAGDANYDPAPQVQQSFLVSLASQTITFTSTAPADAKVGGPTYTVTATATSGLPVAFTIDASAASVCTIAGSTVSFIGVGTCVINANQPGDASYAAAPQEQQSFLVGKGDQIISFTSPAPVNAKVGGPTYNVTATATSGLPVTFTIDASAASVCTIAGSTVSFIGAGTCVINANQAGDANWNAAPQVQQSFAVAKGDQTISFTSTPPAGATAGGPTYTVTATATSGLPVTFTIDPSAASVCTIAGSTVSFIGGGTCVINANQPGDANWNAAPQVQQSFTVVKQNQTISFTSAAPVGQTVAGPTYNVTATATSGLPVTFTIDPSASTVCTIAGSTVSFIGAGTCVINANQAGNAIYNAAPQVQQSFLVVKQDQTITFTSTPPALATIGGPTYTVTATATSGLPVTFTIDPSAASVCTIAGSTVSFIGGGTCVINANQAGNTTYNPAPQVQQSFAVNFPPQIVNTPGFPKEAFDTVGNTGFEFKTVPPSFSPGISVSGRLKDNFTDSDGPSPLSVIAIVDGNTANGGKVDVDTNGEFTYTPKAGDLAASDSFTYQITDGAYTINRTVTINLKGRVWYVKNNQAAGGLGRSMDPFDTLLEAQTASLAGDTIYVYFGDGTIANQNAGIILKNGQRLIGEGVALDVPVSVNGGPNPTVLRAAGTHPKIHNNSDDAGEDVGVSIPATASSLTGIEIRGLDIAGIDNAIDLTATGANNAGATIGNNFIAGANLEGIDVNANSSGTVTVSVSNNTLLAAGNAIDLTRTLGTLYINGFANNVVSGNSTGSGIVVNGPAIFDANPSTGALDVVTGGTTLIGQSGNPVGTGNTHAGLHLFQITGSLNFTDLDIFSAGYALFVQGTGAFTGVAGTSFQVTADVSTLVGTSGGAVDARSATIDLRLAQLTSTTSTFSTAGVNLDTVGGQFRAPSGSSITKAAGTGSAFGVLNSSASVDYAGTINATTGSGVTLTGNSGAMNFTGTLTLSTGTSPAFSATGGGTVTSTDTNSTLATSSGTALTVNGTTIGALGLKFRSISAGSSGSPANGIVLNNSGTGALTVSGTGSAGSGGTIQSTSGDGIRLTNAHNVSLSYMNLTNIASGVTNGSCHFENVSGCEAAIDMSGVSGIVLDDVVIDHNDAGHIGIAGNNVNGLSLTDSSILDVGDADAETGILLQQLTGTVLLEDLLVDDPVEYGIRVFQPTGTGTLNLTLRRVTVQNNINTFGEAGFSIRATDGTSRVLVDDCDFVNTDGPGVDGQSINAAVLHMTVQGSTFTENRALPMAVNFVTDNTSQGFVRIHNNSVTDCAVAADCSIAFDLDANRTSALHAIVTNNNVASGSGIGTGMEFIVGDGATGRAEIRDNNFVMPTGEIGMTFQARSEGFGGTNGRLDVTFEGNTISGIQEAGLFNPGVQFLAGASTGTHDQDVCVNTAISASAGGNTITGTNNPGFTPRFEVTQRTGTVFMLQGFGGTGTNAASVGSHFDTNNNATTLDPTFVRSTGTAIVSYTSGTCNLPTAPTLP